MRKDARTTTLLHAASEYRDAGLCALPAIRDQKRPAVPTWRKYRDRFPTEDEWAAMWRDQIEAICLVCGSVSGNLEILDFDAGGELYRDWFASVSPQLRDRLCVESTPSSGQHVLYRSEAAVSGNLKLAQREDGGTIVTLIETRGVGGIVLCTPSPGYEILAGNLLDLPVLTSTEREELLAAAWDLNEFTPPVCDGEAREASSSVVCGHRPGDDYNHRGDVRSLLRDHGWTCVRGGANEYWRRPGKSSGWSATLKDRVFYVFTSNAALFEPQTAYSPFSVYALLEHDGDFELAARSLSEMGFGDMLAGTLDVDLSAILSNRPRLPDTHQPLDPGLLPEELLRAPGFVSEVMDHCLRTAPYPNVVMAFCGALALQSFLAGRKVRDPGDNRTNLYLLGLAHSAAGKDWPRKINIRVLHEIGQSECVGERFASGEGIQDSLFIHPSTLFQTDEIDSILQSINKARDARHENIMSTLLTLYSSANSVFPMRRKAGIETPQVIVQPCLTLFGTAIPNHYYEAISERMLTNGFFARMLILECRHRGRGQEPSIGDLPPRIIETAKWWSEFRPGKGNLEKWYPIPIIVPQTTEAKRVLVEARREAEQEYAKAESDNDSVGTTVWGRVSEHTRKLALIYAVSENCRDPKIRQSAADWAVRLVMHQTRRMLFMARVHVAENPFHADCLRLMQKLREAPDKTLPHSLLLKRMKIDARGFMEIISTLEQRGDLAVTTTSTAGRPNRCYQLLEGEGDEWGERTG